MKNPIVSFIVVCCILCCQNVVAQITDDVYSNSKTRMVSVSKKVEKANDIDINSNGNTQSISTSKIVGNVTDTKYLLLGGMAIHPSQTSGFVMLGAVKTVGGYIKFKTDFNFDESYDSEGLTTDSRYFTGETQTGRYAFTGGLLWQVTQPILIYGGLGFGNRWANWKTVSGPIYRVTDISHQGLEAEAGLMIKIQKLVLSGGVSATSFNYLEANIGVGIMFGIPPPKIKATREKSAHGGKK